MTHKSRVWYSVKSKSRVWITKSWAEIEWESHPSPFACVYEMHEIFNSNAFQRTAHQILFLTRICPTRISGSFADCKMKAVHWACRSIRVCCEQQWVNSICRRGWIIAREAWSWCAPLLIWQEVKTSNPRIWQMRFNIDRNYFRVIKLAVHCETNFCFTLVLP